MFVTSAKLVRQQLERAGLSQRAAARELGLDERTMRRYCSGELAVPMVVTMALRWLGYVRKNDRVIDLIDNKGARLAYVGTDGDVDVTELEKQRLSGINAKLKIEAKKVVRADRIARRKTGP